MTEELAPGGARASQAYVGFSLGKAAQVGASIDAAYIAQKPEPDSGRAVFQIHQLGAIWRVTLNGSVLGDYRRMEPAMELVEAKACALRSAGHAVTIVTLSSSGSVLVSSILEAV
jgi:hypothetical protein